MIIENVNFNYGRMKVIEDFSYDFKKGKVYGIVGHNGAGKTTLLRIMIGILKPNQGKVVKDIDEIFAYVPERQGVYKDLTVQQNIYIYQRLNGNNQNSDVWLKKWNLMKYKDTIVSNLSTGTLARLKFICSDLDKSNVLICDEPTMGVDAATLRLMCDSLKDYLAHNKMVIVTSHDLNFIKEICDEVLIINDCKIAYSGNKNDFDKLEEVYLECTKENEYE